MKQKFCYNSSVIKDNMSEVLVQAPHSFYKDAKEWYPKAHQYAEEFAKEFNKPVEMTSGLIAVLSPQKEWFHNLDLVREFLRKEGRKTRHTVQQVNKAKLIYQWTEAYSEGIDFIERMLGGQKTTNFFRNILDPTNPDFVTIDSHMAQVMSGKMEYKDPTFKQYNYLKNLLIEFAEEHKMVPSEMQSLLWLTWKSIKPKYITSKEFVIEGDYF